MTDPTDGAAQAPTDEAAPALEVTGLAVRYPRTARETVEDINLTLARGRTLAVVGESGSGKSTIGKAILGLAPLTRGTVRLAGRDIGGLPLGQRREFAHRLQVVFQDPYGSLNPGRRIGDTLAEPLLVRAHADRAAVRARIADVLALVGMPADATDRYPGSFSGGQRQRIAIARALVVDPDVVICDEPTSALDVSTQARVIDLLTDLQQRLGVAYLFITHDLALVSQFAHDVVVLNGGKIVEQGSAREVCTRPRELYTQALMASAPVPDPIEQRVRRERARELLAELRRQDVVASAASEVTA